MLPLVLSVVCAGCSLGPTYQRPDLDMPEMYRGKPDGKNDSAMNPAWWDVLRDDTLRSLIRTALTNNYDLRLAVVRMRQAEAVMVQTRAQRFPAVGYELEASRGRNAVIGNPAPSQHGAIADAFVGTLNAAWEVDLWGRLRRLNEAAYEEFLASDESRRRVDLSLVCNVAQAYYELLELDERLVIACNATNSFGQSLKIFNDRLEGGTASRLETARAEGALAAAAAVVPEVEQEIVFKENQICVLLGRNPGPIARGTSLSSQTPIPDIPVGLPSALLERRPDVRGSERLLRAANARMGVALGNFLPRISLTALYGVVSPELSALTEGKSEAWAFTANVTGPLFQGGQLYGQYQEIVQLREEAELNFRQTVLNAFREVSDALITRKKLKEKRALQERAVEAYQEAVKVATDRYLAGRASYFEVLEAQQALFPAESDLAGVRLAQWLGYIQLFKALGGGWDLD